MTAIIETSKITLKNIEKINELDAITRDYESAIAKCDNKFQIAFVTAEAMRMLRDAITPEMMSSIMTLMNTRLGFKTDKDPNVKIWDKKNGCYKQVKPYDVETVKNVMIEMTLRGLQMIGNQVNIIGGNGYVTKEGFQGLLRDKVDGLTDLDISIDVPKVANDRAVVTCNAEWRMNGIKQSMTADIPIRVNDQMGIDAIIGKAERKIRARIYTRVTGTTITDGDISDISAGGYIDAEPVSENAEKKQSSTKASLLADKIATAIDAELVNESDEVESTPTPEPENEPQAQENVSGDDLERADLCDAIDARAKFKGVTLKRFLASSGISEPLKWREQLTIEQLRELSELVKA